MFDISQVNNGKPEVVVVTPLLPGHKISRETKVTIKRNKIPFIWIKSIGKNNIPKNVSLGVEHIIPKYHSINYVLPLDRDIVLGRGMIDKMYISIKNSPPHIGYTYASFEFKGVVNKAFPAEPFNINKLVTTNYISSNSMIKLTALGEIDGFVVGEKYKRLLDWCMWLKMYDKGIYGLPCPNASFIAISSASDISAGSNEEYKIKAKHVFNDFIQPMIDKEKVMDIKKIKAQSVELEKSPVLEMDF